MTEVVETELPNYVATFMMIGAGRWERSSDAAEHAAVLAADDRLHALMSVEEVYDAVVANYVALESAVTALIVTGVVRPRFNPEASDDRRNVARLLNNLMSSAQAAFDQTRKYGNSIGGKAYKADFETVRAGLRAEGMGFMLMETLRNHSQHVGSAVSSLTYGMSREPKDDLEAPEWTIVYSLNAFTDVKSLMPDRSLNGEDRDAYMALLNSKTLQPKPGTESRPKVDLIPLVRDYVLGVSRIVQAFRAYFVKVETEIFEMQDEICSRLAQEGAPTQGQAIAIKTDRGYQSVARVGVHMQEQIRYLRRRNRDLVGLKRMQIRH